MTDRASTYRFVVSAALAWVCACLGVCEASAQSAGWQPKDGQQMYFDITRNGDKFGHHILTFRRTGDRMDVTSDVLLKAGLGPITLFEYRLDATESYANGALQSVTAKTLNGGKWHPMTASAAEGGLKIQGEKFRGFATGIVSPSSHWNIAEMKQNAMLELETGKPMPISVADMGMDKVKTAKGVVAAHRYRVKSDIVADFWYDEQGRWVKCSFTTQGSRIEYTLRDLPT